MEKKLSSFIRCLNYSYYYRNSTADEIAAVEPDSNRSKRTSSDRIEQQSALPYS